MKNAVQFFLIILVTLLAAKPVSGQLQIISVTAEDADCHGEFSGSITVEISGGASPYQYYLIKGASFYMFFESDATTHVFEGLNAGAYNVVVIDDEGGGDLKSIAVSQPAQLNADVTPNPAGICNGSDLQLSGNPSGGSGNYVIHEWSGAGAAWLNSSDIQNPVFNSGIPGNYDLTYRVVDGNGCETLENIQVTVYETLSAGYTSVDVTCYDGDNGSIIFSGATGGTDDFEYSLGGTVWQSSEAFGALVAGTYELWIRDAAFPDGCRTNIGSVNINQPGLMTASITHDDVTCPGGNNGRIRIGNDATGGSGSYEYRISGFEWQGGRNFNNLVAGNYVVEIRDVADINCVVMLHDSYTVSEPTIPDATITHSDVSCHGGSDGTISISAPAPGTGSYQFRINGSAWQGAGLFQNLIAGDYVIEVRNSNNPGCVMLLDDAYTVSQPATALGGSFSLPTSVLCFGEATGTVTAEGSGGTAPYQYMLDGGTLQASGTFDFLAAGDYTITVVDANGCEYEIPVTITQPASAVEGSVLSQTNVLCFGEATGSVTVEGSGGIAPYQYMLDGGPLQPTGTFDLLAAGDYNVTVVDANGCEYEFPVTITQPASAVEGSVLSQTDVLCFGGTNGSVTVEGSGGTSPYQYMLDGGPIQPTGTFDLLAAGGYTITVVDANGCDYEFPVTIAQPSVLTANKVSQTNVLCFGEATGSLTVEGSGGTAPYQYMLDGGPLQPTGIFDLLETGDYTITVVDVNGCEYEIPVTITQPASAVEGAVLSQTNVLCFGEATGSVTVAGSGGIAPYQFMLDGGPLQPSGTFDLLEAGDYTITVVDSNGCDFDIPVTITQPSELTANTVSQTNVLCFGETNGSVTVAGSGGTGPYQYRLDGGPLQPLGTFDFLAAGNYTITVVDANGCDYGIPVTIAQPSALTANKVSQSNVLCFGESTGSVTVEGSGGTAPYQYMLDGGPLQSNGTFDLLATGDYAVTVVDANGCEYEFPVTITQPSALTANTVSQTNVLCFGEATGSVTVAGSGGTAPYQYMLDGGTLQPNGIFDLLEAGDYTITVVDANGCEHEISVTIIQPDSAVEGTILSKTNVLCFGEATGSVTVEGSGGIAPYQYMLDGGPLQPSGTFDLLEAGEYTITVVDANGCDFDIPVTITQPSALTGNIISQTNVLCFGESTGSVTVEGSGGTAPYQYMLDGGPLQPIGTFDFLAAGGFTITVSDANGCNVDVPVVIAEPGILSAVVNKTDITCFGLANGIIQINDAAGGSGNLEFSIDVVSWQADQIFTGLPAGVYSVSMRDGDFISCEVFLGEITINEPPALSLDITGINQNNCSGALEGAITALASGGTPGYTYYLYDGALEVAILNPAYPDPAVFENLAAGNNYRVVVTDSNGCGPEEISGIVISGPEEIEIVSVLTGNINCHGEESGSITITASGGTGQLLYSIDGATFTNNNGVFENLAPGLYDIAVTDENSCITFGGQEEITEPERLSASIISTNVVCYGAGNGSIEVTNPQGGTSGNYEYSIGGTDWFADPLFENLAAGSYRIWMRNADVPGCFVELDDSPVTITQPESIIDVTIHHDEIDCYGAENGVIYISAEGGALPYNYRLFRSGVEVDIQTSDSPVMFSGLSPGTYNVQVSEANGCFAETPDDIVLAEPDELEISLVNAVNILCAGDTNGTITVMAAGGTGVLEYSITGGADLREDNVFENLLEGSYNIVVRDQKGCETSWPEAITITDPTQIQLQDTVVTDATCFGALNGTIQVSATGGTGTLRYSLDNDSYQMAGMFSGLSAGAYTLYIRDENNCVRVYELDRVGQPDILEVTAQVINIDCFDTSGDPQITAMASGGTAPYTVSLYLDGVLQESRSGTNEAEMVTFGSLILNRTGYTVVVEDAAGCTPVNSGMLSTVLPEEFILGDMDYSGLVCFGTDEGSIEISAAGGTAPYVYSLYDHLDDVIGTIETGDAALFDMLPAGTFRVTITDAKGCGPLVSEVITITQPEAIVVDYLVSQDLSCHGSGDGIISIMASGGTGAIGYSIDAGEEFYLSGSFTGLMAGEFRIMVRDETGCVLNGGIVSLEQPDELLFDFVHIEDIITGSNEYGTIEIGMTGGTGARLYSINNGADWQNGGLFDQLEAGEYNILVTDENDCLKDTTVYILELTGITAVVDPAPPSCYGFSDGEILISIETGTPPYQISVNGGPWSEMSEPSWNIGELPSGDYDVEIRDAGGYIFRDLIVLAGPDPVQASAEITGATCFRYDPLNAVTPDGAIMLTVSGGTGEYSYLWSNGAVTRDVDRLEAGEYSVMITDSNDCQSDFDFITGYENTVEISFTAGEYTICPGSTVQLETILLPEGTNVSWSWTASDGSNVQPVASPVVAPAGSVVYRVEVTDENFCYDVAEISVDPYPVQGISIGNDTVLLQGTTIELEAEGGEFMNYEWTPSTGLSVVSGPVTTATVMNDIEYFVYAVTQDGCEEYASIAIGVLIPVQPVSGFSPNGDGINDLFDITYADDYPEIVVEVFNRAGQRVFYSRGYSDDQRWDGTYNGRDLPLGTYYYVITLNDVFGTRPVTGPVTILR